MVDIVDTEVWEKVRTEFGHYFSQQVNEQVVQNIWQVVEEKTLQNIEPLILQEMKEY